MGSQVRGFMARNRRYDMFVDLTGPEVAVAFGRIDGSADTLVTFDADLDPAVADLVWQRMTSRDDAHQAARLALRDLVDAADPETADPLLVALARIELGDDGGST